MHISVGSY
uniref:Uncharacterized protein n=1 Tax=Arundo donax TaxID=35708 RepID=A0A0A9B410_ARUDO